MTRPAKSHGRKRGRGRPPRHADDPATAQVMIRMSPAEKRAAVDVAEAEGQSLSAWVRDTVRERLGL